MVIWSVEPELKNSSELSMIDAQVANLDFDEATSSTHREKLSHHVGASQNKGYC